MPIEPIVAEYRYRLICKHPILAEHYWPVTEATHVYVVEYTLCDERGADCRGAHVVILHSGISHSIRDKREYFDFYGIPMPYMILSLSLLYGLYVIMSCYISIFLLKSHNKQSPLQSPVRCLFTV